MVFNSLEFAAFFVIVVAVYAMLGHRSQNWLLLAASYVFYGAWDYRFLGLLFLTTVVDFLVGVALAREEAQAKRKRLLCVSLAFNLGVLGIFKYFNFFAESLVDMAAAFGMTVSTVPLKIILPVGVSFYTFQSMSYTIDVYRRRIDASRNLADFALYVAFFPQLVAGPIERARRLLPQIEKPRQMTAGKIGTGLFLVVLGLIKKVVLADNLAGPVDNVFSQSGLPGELVVMGSLYFAFQIYFDFSGYSDIARGLARILGFELMVNFRQPFFSRSPGELLRRWHISLGTWLRDYLFQPLGGMRRSNLLTLRNITITMALAGLWHGAAWNFVLWGVYVAAALVVYRLYDLYVLPVVDRTFAPFTWSRFARAAIARVVMFLGTVYAFMIFRAGSFSQIEDMTLALGHFDSLGPIVVMGTKLLALTGPFIVLDFWEYRRDKVDSFVRAPLLVQTAAYSAGFLLFLMVGEYDAASFIYFQF